VNICRSSASSKPLTVSPSPRLRARDLLLQTRGTVPLLKTPGKEPHTCICIRRALLNCSARRKRALYLCFFSSGFLFGVRVYSNLLVRISLAISFHRPHPPLHHHTLPHLTRHTQPPRSCAYSFVRFLRHPIVSEERVSRFTCLRSLRHHLPLIQTFESPFRASLLIFGRALTSRQPCRAFSVACAIGSCACSGMHITTASYCPFSPAVCTSMQTSSDFQADGLRATEMDITMIGLQNAGKTSLLRVLGVSHQLRVSLSLQPSLGQTN